MVQRERRVGRTSRVVFGARVSKIRRLRYRIRAIVRHSLRPRRVGTVKRIPTGKTRDEAIPFVFYKTPGMYPQSITLSARNPNRAAAWDNPPPVHPASAGFLGSATVQTPRQQRIRPGPFSGRATITLGVRPTFLPWRGKRMKRVRAADDRGPTVGSLRTLFRNYEVPLSGREVDHVQDLAYSGSDTAANLWPLASALNQGAKNRTNQSQRVRYQRNNDEATNVPNRMIGKWFKISRTSRP
jgi:hypothetical protein